jgi:outer membrane protein W
MKRGLMLFAVCSLVFAAGASAAVQQGETELNLLGGYFWENGTKGQQDQGLGFVSGGIGYFFTDNLELEADAAYVNTHNVTVLDDSNTWMVGGKAKYYFMPTNQWVPYIGLQAFWGEVDSSNDTLGGTRGSLWGPIGGLRFELNANNDFFVEAQYHIWGSNLHDLLDDGFGVFFGIVHEFKK